MGITIVPQNRQIYVNDPLLTAAHGSNPLISDVSYVNKFGRNPATTVGEAIQDEGGVISINT